MADREWQGTESEDAQEQVEAPRRPAPGKISSSSLVGADQPRWYRPTPGKRPLTMSLTRSSSAGAKAETSAQASGPIEASAPTQASAPAAAENPAPTSSPAAAPAHRDVVSRMEGAFGMSFSDVAVRTDSEAAGRASSMGARAWTDGRQIGFAEGRFDPGSREGLHTIAHEFAHVAQARGGTAGALGGGFSLGSDGVRGKDDGGGAADDIESAADAAADAVVAGESPNVEVAELGAIAFDKGGRKTPTKVPPVGSYYVGISAGGDLHYSFNGDEVRKSWAGDGIHEAVGYYIRDAFPGASASVIDDCAVAVGLHWRNGFAPKSYVGPVMTMRVVKDVHDSVAAWFAKNHPEIKGRLISSGFKDSGDGAGGSGGDPRGATTTPGGKAPEVASKELDQLKAIYEWIAKNFGNHVVFGEGGMSVHDFLAFHAAHPELFADLPPLTKPGQPTTDPEKWKKFLDEWKKHRDRESAGAEGGSPDGHPRGEKDGKPGGVIRFSPRATLTLAPKVDKYVKGSSVKGTVLYDQSDADNNAMNVFESRASYDWTLIDTATDKVADTGPLLERMGGYRNYTVDLDSTGTFHLRVAVRSAYFKDPTELWLDSPNLVVVTEAAREKEVFESLHVGTYDPKKPFERDESTGKLKLKSGFSPLSLDDEVSSLDLQLGGLKALHEQGKLTKQEFDDYTAYFDKQKQGLLEAKKKIEVNGKDPSQKNPTYFVRGTYVSRETSAAMEVKAYMTQTRREKSGSKVDLGVHLIDASLDPGNPTHHEGDDGEVVGADEKAAWAKAEKNAIQEMAEHWNKYNDYPDGKVHLAIKCLESEEVIEKSIDTYHIRKTGKAILGGVAMVGGVILIAASPFTGGGSAVVGVIFITTAVAGTAATLMSVQERYEKENELKIDGRLALDVLQLVSTFMAAGSFSNAFKAWGTVGKAMYLGSMLGLDVAQGVLIAGDVKDQLLAVEAVYKPKILAAQGDEKARLERERDSALAQILGHAMISGGFILVSVGTGIHQIRSVGRMSGKAYTVREEIKSIVESGDQAAIREALEKKAVSFEEKAYLEEALATTKKAGNEEGGDKEAPGDKDNVPADKDKVPADKDKTPEAEGGGGGDKDKGGGKDGEPPGGDKTPSGGDKDPSGKLQPTAAQEAAAAKVKDLRKARSAETDPTKRAALDAEIEAALAGARGDLEAMVRKIHPSLEAVDASKNLYKVSIDGKEYFGTLEALLDFTAPTAAARAAGDRLFSSGSKTDDATVEVSSGLGGTGAQGRANKHPGDIDLTESMKVTAKSASAAAEAMAKTIQASVERGSQAGPGGQAPLAFSRMALGKIPDGPKAGGTVVWSKADIARGYVEYKGASGEIKTYSLADAIAAGDGNAIAYWNGPVDARGTYGEITKAIRYEAIGPDGAKLFGTPEIGQAFQQVTFDKPPVIHDLNRPWLTDELSRQIAGEAASGNWLKAAKRAYTVARLNGDVRAMAELEPFLAGDPARNKVVTEHLTKFLDDVVKVSGEVAKSGSMTPETARANAEMLAERVAEVDPALGAKMKELIDGAPDVRGNKKLGISLKTDILTPLGRNTADPAFGEAVKKALTDLGYLR